MVPLDKPVNKPIVFSVALALGVVANVNPNVKGNNHDEVYLKTSLVCFSTLSKFYPGSVLRLYVVSDLQEVWGSEFERLGVDVIKLPFKHLPPLGFSARFQAALFILDVVQSLEKSSHHIILDPDVVATAFFDLEKVFAMNLVGALPLKLKRDEAVNGLTLGQQVAIQKRHGIVEPKNVHFGGEWYLLPASQVANLQLALAKSWVAANDDFKSEQSHFKTMEHIFNHALNLVPTFDASRIVARIWTTVTTREVPKEITKIPFWHLPAEKNYGFLKFYEDSVRKGAPKSNVWGFSDNHFMKNLLRTMSISGFGLVQRGRRAFRVLADILNRRD